MALKNEVAEYFKQKIIEAGYELTITHKKDYTYAIAKKGNIMTPQMVCKSELGAVVRVFFWIFFKTFLKKCSETLDK
jgi:hypothetical protein